MNVKRSGLCILLAIAMVLGILMVGCNKKEKSDIETEPNKPAPIKSADEIIKDMNELATEYGCENALSELTEKNTTTTDGNTYYRLQQNYHGIPVYGRDAVYATGCNEYNILSGN